MGKLRPLCCLLSFGSNHLAAACFALLYVCVRIYVALCGVCARACVCKFVQVLCGVCMCAGSDASARCAGGLAWLHIHVLHRTHQ